LERTINSSTRNGYDMSDYMASTGNPLERDLDHILEHTGDLWEDLRGRSIFITGGTGFFGVWLLESFAWANERLDLRASALVLTRNQESFRKQSPHLAANPSIRFHEGDVRNFDFPGGNFSYIIHAATTSALATFQGEDPLVKFETIVEGTRHTLDFAVQCNARKVLMTSSGSVYGKPPSDMTYIQESYCGAPDPSDLKSALGEGKRAAEFLCAYYSERYGIETKIPRCFSFVGPYLPLNIHYAIGNFIGDALKGGPIRVTGDGTPYRSYLYAADLAIWLWTILFRGESCRAYNVGSEEYVTISELANIVAQSMPQPIEVIIANESNSGNATNRYVPSTKRAQHELGIEQVVNLREAVRRTIAFVQTKTEAQYL
jgi:nucleoside-diphosphate-sugar epimerase